MCMLLLLLLLVIKRKEARIAAKKSFHTRIENCKYIKGHAMQLNKLPNDDAGQGREEGRGGAGQARSAWQACCKLAWHATVCSSPKTLEHAIFVDYELHLVSSASSRLASSVGYNFPYMLSSSCNNLHATLHLMWHATLRRIASAARKPHNRLIAM